MKTTYIVSNGTSVRIGVTQDPLNIIRHLQPGSSIPLKLLAVLPGDHQQELHSLFKTEHENGKWFSLTDRIQEMITQQQAGLYETWLAQNIHYIAQQGSITNDDWYKKLSEFVRTIQPEGVYFIRRCATHSLWNYLGVPTKERTPLKARKIAAIMRSLGFRRTRVRLESKTVVGYVEVK